MLRYDPSPHGLRLDYWKPPNLLNSAGSDPLFTDTTVAGMALPPETSAGVGGAGDATLPSEVATGVNHGGCAALPLGEAAGAGAGVH